jgi:hypothetical protein
MYFALGDTKEEMEIAQSYEYPLDIRLEFVRAKKVKKLILRQDIERRDHDSSLQDAALSQDSV